ncbi:response regulator [Azospirillum sp.]|uniref:response regulator n=1 Tax=Azospirillum sp. TaxID=34012 RepID=UPI002D54D983|nr:response regulator [Azospirillum sp.]HYF88007.1 response regulator [Azospirillum sp.]
MLITHSIRILIVEDDIICAMALGSVCEAEGHHVVGANNGQEGLQAFSSAPFDLVVSDLNMPKLDDRQMICQLRDEWPCLPIIILTGTRPTGGVGALQGNDPGLTVLLEKPVNGNDLLAAIRSIFWSEPSPAVLRLNPDWWYQNNAASGPITRATGAC